MNNDDDISSFRTDILSYLYKKMPKVKASTSNSFKTFENSLNESNVQKEKIIYEKFSKPPKFEDMSKESRDILSTQDIFQGFKADIQKNISPNFGIAHSVHLGSSNSRSEPKKDYSFMTNYARNNIIFIGRVSSLNEHFARIIYIINKRSELTLTSAIQSSQNKEARSFTIEYIRRSFDSSLSLKCTNESVPQGSLSVFGLNYTKKIMHSITTGVEFTYIPNNSMLMTSGNLRIEWSTLNKALRKQLFIRKNNIRLRALNVRKVRDLFPPERMEINEAIFEPKAIISTSFSPNQFEINYTNSLSHKLGISTSLIYAVPPPYIQSDQLLIPSWKMGFNFDNGFISVKGVVTDLINIDSKIDQKINPMMSISLSSSANLKDSFYNFGLGINMNI